MADIFSNLLRQEGPVDVLLGGPEHRHKMAMMPLERERVKAQTQYYKGREETGGRASIDRLLTIIRNLGNDASPEFLDSALTFILHTDPGLAALSQKMTGKDMIGSRKGTIEEAEKMRIFRNSLLEQDNSVLPENQKLFDDISKTYRNMLNNLSKTYGGGKEEKSADTGAGEYGKELWDMYGKVLSPSMAAEEAGKSGGMGALGNIPYGPQEMPAGYTPSAAETRPPMTAREGPTMLELQREAGLYDRKKTVKKPDTPKSGDPVEIEAYRTLLGIWGELDRQIAEKILALRASGVPYDKIMGADELQPYLKK